MTRYHFDTDFLVKAVSYPSAERDILRHIAAQHAELEMSALAWYEYARGPRSPAALAQARDHLAAGGVLAVTEAIAEQAADVFRRLGSPRRTSSDIVIAVTAMSRGARLLTGNLRDYSGIDGLLLGER